MASILVVSGKSKGEYYPLKDGTYLVGREETCDIQILDEMVSRRHMEVRANPGTKTFTVNDLDSANGVFVNGQRITEETPLADEDAIKVGETKLYFTDKDFLGREEAFEHMAIKKRGERGKSTLIQ